MYRFAKTGLLALALGVRTLSTHRVSSRQRFTMTRCKSILAPGFALALALTFGVGTASAAFSLNVDHGGGSAVTVSPEYGHVDVSGGGTSVTIVYTANTTRVVGFHEIGFNIALTGGA